MFDLKAMVKGTKVKFVRFQMNELFYETECGVVFPEPIGDTGTGIFTAEDKAITYMRWIRKEINRVEAEAEQLVKWKEQAA